MEQNRLLLSENAFKRHGKRLKDELKNFGLTLKLNDSYNLLARIFGTADYHELKSLFSVEKDSEPLDWNELFDYMYREDKRELLIHKGMFIENKEINQNLIDALIHYVNTGSMYMHNNRIAQSYTMAAHGHFILIKCEYVPFKKLNIDYAMYHEPGLHLILGGVGTGKSTLLSNIINVQKYEYGLKGYLNIDDILINPSKREKIPALQKVYSSYSRASLTTDFSKLDVDLVYLDDIYWNRGSFTYILDAIKNNKSVILVVHGYSIESFIKDAVSVHEKGYRFDETEFIDTLKKAIKTVSYTEYKDNKYQVTFSSV